MSAENGPTGRADVVPGDGNDGDLFRLLYSSVAVVDLSREEMGGLLRRSRRNNDRDAITGLLVHLHDPDPGRAYFIQVLEGTESAVEMTYRRIAADELHRDVTLLTCGPTPLRAFGAWSMMLHSLASPEATRILTKVELHPDLTLPPPEWITDLAQVEHLMERLTADLDEGASRLA